MDESIKSSWWIGVYKCYNFSYVNVRKICTYLILLSSPTPKEEDL